ncbi:MAG: EamA family transporter [Anaerolineae bacterium]|nr:EamA family transporter [Anaerolineae bacterium]
MVTHISARRNLRIWLHGLVTHQINLLLAGMVIIWGANFIATKVALRTISPLSFNALRFPTATMLFVLILRHRGQPLGIARADVWKVIALGILGHGLYQVFFIEGLAHTTAANSSLLMATVPVFVALFSVALRIEHVAWRRWLGIFLSFAGIVLVTVGSGGRLDWGGSHLLGDMLILGAAITWAMYTVASKPLLTRYSPLHWMAVTMIPGTIVLVLVGLPELLRLPWGSVGVLAWLGLGYATVFSIVIAYLVWFTGVQRIGNARTSVYSNGVPVVATLLAWTVLHEPFRLLQAIGGIVILTGLTLTQSRERTHIRRFMSRR